MFSDKVNRAIKLIEADAGRMFPHDEIVFFLETTRGKRFKHLELPMPIGLKGFAVALKDYDVAATRIDLEPEQKMFSIYHEMSHFLLDIALYSCKNAPMLAEFLQNPASWYHICKKKSPYRTPEEYDAESLGRWIMLRVLRYNTIVRKTTIIPRYATGYYGLNKNEDN